MTFKVYVKTDKNNNIKQINSSFCLENTSNWIEIDEGDGVRYMHAQTQYLSGEVITKDGILRYKLADGKAQERTEEEIEADRVLILPPPPSLEERVESLEQAGGSAVWDEMAAAIREGVNSV